MEALKHKKLFLLDMDGTLYLGEQLFTQTKAFLQQIRENGGRYLFLTNNSSKNVRAYVEKMARLGIPATEDDFFTSAMATVLHLQAHYAADTVYVEGTDSLRQELEAGGITTATAPTNEVTCLLAGYDTELTFRKLEDACILLNRGVKYLATHPDMVCPTEYGSAPDCGSVCEMLWHATGRRPSAIIGKPQPAMAQLAMQKCGVTPEETVMIGDRIYTDIACGVNAGIDTVLVFSGETTPEDLQKSATRPTYTAADVGEILKYLR